MTLRQELLSMAGVQSQASEALLTAVKQEISRRGNELMASASIYVELPSSATASAVSSLITRLQAEEQLSARQVRLTQGEMAIEVFAPKPDDSESRLICTSVDLELDVAPEGGQESGAIKIWRDKLKFMLASLVDQIDSRQRVSIFANILDCVQHINALASYKPQRLSVLDRLEELQCDEAIASCPVRLFEIREEIEALKRRLGTV